VVSCPHYIDFYFINPDQITNLSLIMKKSFITLMLMLVSVLALNAQSLTGKE